MEISTVIMVAGFLLAAYSVVGNDVIQTLGTFLSSNEKKPWYVLWGFASIILIAVLIYGYLDPKDLYDYGIAYGRLDKFTIPTHLEWYYLLPPLVLLVVTRMGIPVSTTFLILTLFSLSSIEGNSIGEIVSKVVDMDSKLGQMIKKSLMGYALAFAAAFALYIFFVDLLEKRFIKNPIKHVKWWTAAQWFSTGWLWWQWLTQDLANIYIYLLGKGELSVLHFGLSVLALVLLLGFIFYKKGGAVQQIVKRKTNTVDIRSATFVDLSYGMILYIFKYDSILGLNYNFPWTGKLPMSTTWVFIGLLAGRELAIRLRLEGRIEKSVFKDVGKDFGKVMFGLIVSVVLVIIIKLLGG
ncbi:MAG: hypothetical protein R2730_14115 [Chitinophagales bacterium]